jgi:hypothetical protein
MRTAAPWSGEGLCEVTLSRRDSVADYVQHMADGIRTPFGFKVH